MKYNELIQMVFSEKSVGYANIQNSSEEFKTKLLGTIERAKCSIATASVFLGYVDHKLSLGEEVKLGSTMEEAAIFVGNGVGLDPTRYSETLTLQDMSDLKAVNNFNAGGVTNGF